MNKSSWRSGRDLNTERPYYKSTALTVVETSFFDPLFSFFPHCRAWSQATILVTNLETLVWFLPSPMLIWVLQSFQWSKIPVAQHWGRKGAYLSENKGVKSECKKFGKNPRKKRLLFQRFVTSIVALPPLIQRCGFWNRAADLILFFELSVRLLFEGRAYLEPELKNRNT